jgi:hypothetical protein
MLVEYYIGLYHVNMEIWRRVGLCLWRLNLWSVSEQDL